MHLIHTTETHNTKRETYDIQLLPAPEKTQSRNQKESPSIDKRTRYIITRHNIGGSSQPQFGSKKETKSFPRQGKHTALHLHDNGRRHRESLTGGGDASVDTHSPERPLQTHSSPHARSFTRSNSNTNKRCRENMQRRASDCALLGNAKPNPTLKRRVGTLNSCTILHHYLTFAHYHNQKKTSTSGSLLKPQKQPTESRLLGTKAAASPNAKKWNSPPGMRAGSGNTRRCGEILTTHTPTFATNLKLQIVPTKGLLPANHRTRHTMSHDRKTYPLN